MLFRQLGAYCGIVGGLATFDTAIPQSILRDLIPIALAIYPFVGTKRG
jgi:hypothetical protein